MSFPVIKASYKAEDLKIDPYEVLRYLGYKRALVTPEDIARVEGLLPQARAAIRPAACWSRFDIELLADEKIRLPYGTVRSADLSRNLRPCSQIFIFAATIGIAYDRLVQAARLSSMARASLLNAIGAAAVEDVCDRLNKELRQLAQGEGKSLRHRYSPGYGDYGLENQRGIFSLLEPSKHIGLTLKDNLIMVPEKSVTALVGLVPELVT